MKSLAGTTIKEVLYFNFIPRLHASPVAMKDTTVTRLFMQYLTLFHEDKV